MRLAWLGLLVVVACAACGGRPGPLRDFADGGPTVTPDAAATDARADGPPRDAVQADAALLPACNAIVDPGMVSEELTHPGKSVYSPSLVVLEPGSADAPARVAIQAIVTNGDGAHPYDEVARLAVGPGWPPETAVDVAPQPCGTESHSYAQLTRAPGGRNELALAWLGDPGGQISVLFRTIDLASFTCGTTVTVSQTGSTPWGLVAGAGVGGPGPGYAGDGYGIVWEEITQSGNESLRQPVVVLLDPAGGVILPAVPVAAAVPYPDFDERMPSLVWSGASYLIATAFDRCGPADPLCAPGAVVVTRLRPDGAGGRLEIAATVPVLAAGTVPQRPVLARDERGLVMVWAEGPVDAPPPTIRGVALSAAGGLDGTVHVIEAAAAPIGGVRLAALSLGRVVIWPEDGDPGLADQSFGRSWLVFQLLDGSIAAHGVPVRLPSPLFSSHNVAPTVELPAPRMLLHSWSARSQDGGRDAAFIGFVRCSAAD